MPNEQRMYEGTTANFKAKKVGTLRRDVGDSPNPMLNHGVSIPGNEKWTLNDFTDWTGKGFGDIVQALVFGICRQKDYRIIERILRDGGLEVKPGKKVPLP